MSFCPFCAQELPDDGARSCVFCGKRLPTAGAQPAQSVEPSASEKKTVMGMPALSAPAPGGTPGQPEAPNRSTVKGFEAPQGGASGASAWPSLPSSPPPSAAPTPPAMPPPPSVPAAPTPPAMPPPPAVPAAPPPAAPPLQAMAEDLLNPDDLAKTVMDEVPVENAIAFLEEAIGEPLA